MEARTLSQFAEMLAGGNDLTAEHAKECFEVIVSEQDEAELEMFFNAWNTKGIVAEELFFFAEVMRQRMKRICNGSGGLVELVGTGGSAAKTFNISTAAALAAAGCGLRIAKHGNRAATSLSGSADVLRELGVIVDAEPEAAEQCLATNGICFMFAPKFHSLSPQLARVRKRLGQPTIFNNLGPLCNPAGAEHQIIGVWDENLLRRTASVLQRLGTKRSWIVNGAGLDEITVEATTNVFEVTPDGVKQFDIVPEDFGIERSSLKDFGKLPPEESAELIIEILQNRQKRTSAEKIVLLNAAAAVFVADVSPTLPDAYIKAKKSLRSGAAFEKLEKLRSYQGNNHVSK